MQSLKKKKWFIILLLLLSCTCCFSIGFASWEIAGSDNSNISNSITIDEYRDTFVRIPNCLSFVSSTSISFSKHGFAQSDGSYSNYTSLNFVFDFNGSVTGSTFGTQNNVVKDLSMKVLFADSSKDSSLSGVLRALTYDTNSSTDVETGTFEFTKDEGVSLSLTDGNLVQPDNKYDDMVDSTYTGNDVNHDGIVKFFEIRNLDKNTNSRFTISMKLKYVGSSFETFFNKYKQGGTSNLKCYIYVEDL